MDENTRALAAATGRHIALIWATLVRNGKLSPEDVRVALDELSYEDAETPAAKALEREIVLAVRDAVT